MRAIAISSLSYLGYLMASGFMIMIFLQTFINIGMNLGIVPVTGVPLPFLSYGGSSLVMCLAIIGILQNIYLKSLKNRA